MPGAHWPPEVIARARHLRGQGLSNLEVAKIITEETGRPVHRRYIHKWCKDMPLFYASRQPWAKKWWQRAQVLRREGISLESIADIITIEARRPCHLTTVKRWIGLPKVRAHLHPKPQEHPPVQTQLESCGDEVIERHPTLV